MKDGRLIRHCLYLALPTAALVAFGAYFLIASVPRISANERARFESEARQIADEIRQGDRPAGFVWEYGVGVVEGDSAWRGEFPAQMLWKDWEVSALRKGVSMWGVKRRSDALPVVWLRDGRRVYAVEADISETDYALIFRIAVPLLLLCILAATVFAVASLRAYAKSRDDFLAAAAHDLATPLVGMRYLIRKESEDVRNLNERMIRLVENIREFLSLGGRRKAPLYRVFRIGDAFDEAYRIFAADYEDLASGPVAVTGDRTLEVCADEDMTTQILWNLLGNDLKYAAPYGKVSVGFSAVDGFVKVVLEDEGQGMSRSQMRHAFDRYWRAKTVLESGKGGFGIGLCASREAARLMGGDLTVSANTPKGCVFTLTLKNGKISKMKEAFNEK